jgi:hypothetical protein
MSKRGRPKLNTNNITINELLVEYLSTKVDKFNNEISYFKIVDSAFRIKLKPLFSLNDDGNLKLPIWTTEDKNEQILKVKDRWIGSLKELNKKELYNIDIDFEHYTMETDNGVVKGYYAKVPTIKPVVPKTIETNPEN